jgi:glutamate--cysteine ligase
VPGALADFRLISAPHRQYKKGNTVAKPMSNQLERRLALLDDDAHRGLLMQGLRGIERETLRVDSQGHLARSPHPVQLGSALTHPQITTDYAEALLEFITPAEHDIGLAIHRLDAVHRYAYSKLGGEMLWSQSMPCDLPSEEEIEIAWYGTSNIGMLKHVYRRGLALRYGKAMQCIAGIHYNYSLPEQLWTLILQSEGVKEERRHALRDFQSESYIAMIRNFRRYSWLLMYLFGASPVLAKGFLRGRAHNLDTLSDDTLYLPYATSLRMSDLGYQNDAQSGLRPHENSLESYVTSLMDAVNRPYPPYEEPRRAVHRGALPRRRPLRTGRHRPRNRPLPGRLPALLRARGKPEDQCDGRPGPRAQLRPHREGRPRSRPDPHPQRRRGAAEGLGA